MARWVEPCMGTVFSIEVAAAHAVADGAVADVIRWLHWVDATFSPFRDDSQVSRLGRGELRLADAAPELREVLDLCAAATAATRGYFSARYAGGVDPTGLVKGWSVQHASGRLLAAGFPNHSVNGGGDVRIRGLTPAGGPWRVGLADPRTPGALLAVVAGSDLGIATSGPTERGAHVVDPFTGRPATGVLAATVTGPDLALADAYATAAVAMGGGAALDWLADVPGYEGLVLDEAGIRATRGFPAAP